MTRLTRLGWCYTEAPIYFITAATHERQRILADEGVHEAFRAFCTVARNHGALVGRYVLMPGSPSPLRLHLSWCSWLISLDEIAEEQLVETLARARNRGSSLAERLL